MCHTHLKDSDVTWLGNGNHFVSAGYNTVSHCLTLLPLLALHIIQSRDAEIALWDLCNLSKPITKQSLGNASGYVIASQIYHSVYFNCVVYR